jgi:hypothetical protein
MAKHRNPHKYDDFAIPITRKREGISDTERDDRMKNLMIVLEYLLLTIGIDAIHQIIRKHKDAYQMDHITNKGSHNESRYDFDNLQLLTPEQHEEKTQTGKYIDLRDNDHKEFIKLINFMER